MKVREMFSRPFAPPPAVGEGAVLFSGMPAGGRPDDDRKFLAFIDIYAATANARALDTLARRGETPKDDPVRSWALMGHLYKHLSGLVFPAGMGPTWSHRVRYLAIQYRLRPAEVLAELDAYTATLLPDTDADA
jgi:hypothetical protein